MQGRFGSAVAPHPVRGEVGVVGHAVSGWTCSAMSCVRATVGIVGDGRADGGGVPGEVHERDVDGGGVDGVRVPAGEGREGGVEVVPEVQTGHRCSVPRGVGPGGRAQVVSAGRISGCTAADLRVHGGTRVDALPRRGVSRARAACVESLGGPVFLPRAVPAAGAVAVRVGGHGEVEEPRAGRASALPARVSRVRCTVPLCFARVVAVPPTGGWGFEPGLRTLVAVLSRHVRIHERPGTGVGAES